MTHRFQSLALLIVPLAACGGQALDVGSNSGGSGGAGSATGAGNMSTGASAGEPMGPDTTSVGAYGNVTYAGSSTAGDCLEDPPPGPALPEWPAREDCQEGSSALQGTWRGYVQGQAAGGYPDEGNFTITLKGDDDALCGTIRFGAPTELAPATDAAAWYPPGYERDTTKGMPLIEGYTYQLTEPTLDGKRLQFDLLIAEPMRSWCQLQTSYFDALNGVGWSCHRNLGTRYTYDPVQQCHQVDPCTQAALVVSCAQVEICGNLAQPCACNETGCDGNTEVSVYHAFDLRFEGDEATGELNGSVVYLTRQ